MKMRSLAIVTAALLLSAITSPAWAMYNPAIGRFMQRDPGASSVMADVSTTSRVGLTETAVIGGFVPRDPVPAYLQPEAKYADGMNMYQYVMSSPVRLAEPNRIVRLQPDGRLQVMGASDGQVLDELPKGRSYRKQAHEQVTLIPSEDGRVRAVQKMFADYANGIPCRRIRDELNQAGFRTTFCRTFSIPSINVILENSAYLGKCVYNKRTSSKFHRIIDGASVDRHDEGFEYRPEADWIITDNAWPAIIDPDTFDRVQQRRKDSRARERHTRGRAVHAENLIVGLCKCGVCGGKLVAQTTTSGKGYRTRYYICGTHHRGDHEACPKRYTVPADIVEQHIIGLIRADLERLADDQQVHEFMREELRRVRGIQHDGYENLQHRLAELDQLSARIRDHLFAMDHETAKDMGLYEQARTLREERQKIEQALTEHAAKLPPLPSIDEIRSRAQAGCRRLEQVMNCGSVEEKREMIALYVHEIVSDPEKQRVAIALYPPAFNQKIGVTPDSAGDDHQRLMDGDPCRMATLTTLN